MAGEGNRLGCLPERFSRPLPFTLRIVILQVFTLTTTELLGQLSSELSSESLSAYETLGAAILIKSIVSTWPCVSPGASCSAPHAALPNSTFFECVVRCSQTPSPRVIERIQSSHHKLHCLFKVVSWDH